MAQAPTASKVLLDLGPMFQLYVDAVAVKAPGAAKKLQTKRCCPICAQDGRAVRINMQNHCAEHGQLDETVPAVEVNGELKLVEAEAVKAVKTAGVAERHVAFQWSPVEQLEAATRPGEQAFRLRLPKDMAAAADLYALFAHLVKSTGLAFYGYGKLNNRLNAQWYRLECWREQLVLQSLLNPHDLAEADYTAGELSEKGAKVAPMAETFITSAAVDLDTAIFADDRAERLLALAEGAAPALATVPKGEKGDSMDSLLAALEASLKAA